jgi:threonine dehydratase
VAVEIIRAGMDRVVMVDDDEVRDAMRAYFVDTHNVAEGAGAGGLAGLLKDRANGGQRVGTVLTGGNVNSEVFGEVLCESGVSSLA